MLQFIRKGNRRFTATPRQRPHSEVIKNRLKTQQVTPRGERRIDDSPHPRNESGLAGRNAEEAPKADPYDTTAAAEAAAKPKTQ